MYPCMMGTWGAKQPATQVVGPRSLIGLLYRSIVLSGCLRCSGTHPKLWVNACACLNQACRVRLITTPLLSSFLVDLLPIIYPTALHLSIQGLTVETHVGAVGTFDWSVVTMVAGDQTSIPALTMTESMGVETVFSEMSLQGAVLAFA